MAKPNEIKRANYILERASAMNVVKQQYSTKWKEYEKRFKMIEEKRSGEDAWRASLPDTWGYATYKTAQSAFVDSKVIPTIISHPDDPKTKAEDTKNLYTDIAEKGNLDIELYYTRQDTFKLGNGYTKTIYVKDTRWVWDIKKFDPIKNEFVWEKKQITEFDDPKTIRVSPYLMLVDDLARGVPESVRDRIELEVMGRDEAKERYGHLVDFDNIPETIYLLDQLKESSSVQVAETDGTGVRGTEFETLQSYQFFAPGFEWSNDYVEILHYLNTGITTPSGCSDSKEMLINGYPVVVDTKEKPAPIPYIHKQDYYTDFKFSPYSGDEHYAAGIFEIGEAEAKALQKHREMMADRQKISLFSPVFADVGTEIDQKQLKLKPLSVIQAKNGRVTHTQIPGISNGDLALQDRYEAGFKRAVGIDERILGVESTGPRLTATEISFLREAAMKRLREFAFLYKNALLQREIKIKLSLFKQYFSNPLSREPKVKNDKSSREFINKFKEFKIRSGNTYRRKELTENFFEGEVDVDLDLQLLLPLTQAQIAAMWSQAIRDNLPAIQAGVVDYSIKKMYDKYNEALLGVNPESLTEDTEELSIETAEKEHELFANKNTSKDMPTILPNGTAEQLLTPGHLKKHNELLNGDIRIEETEKARLIEHIQKDSDNFKKKQVKQSQPNLGSFTPESLSTIGGIGGVAQPTAPLPANQVPSL